MSPEHNKAIAGARDLGRLLLGHSQRYRDAKLQDVVTAALRDSGAGRSRVLSVLNGSIRVRQELAYALRLEPRRLWTKLTFARRTAAVPSRTQSLSLLCPTRNRVANLAEFLRSVHRTAAAPGRIEVLAYVDEDDPALPEYRELFAHARLRFAGLARCALHVGPPIGVAAAWNHLAEQAEGNFLLMANDDQLYVDHGWDVALDRRVAELTVMHEDAVLCLYFDAAQYADGGRDFPIVSRSWYETLGYFVPTIFQQWEVEQWVFDLAERLGRLYAVSGVFVEHRHYQDYKAPFDETYQRHRMTRNKSFADHALFLRTEAERVAETAKLAARVARGHQDGPANGRRVGLTEALSERVRERYRALIDELHAVAQHEAAAQCADLAVRQGLWASSLHRPVEYDPELPVVTEHDAQDLWFTAHLAARHHAIAAELRAEFGARSPDREDGGAEPLPLYSDGTWTAAAAALPVTRAALDDIPEALLFPGAVVELWSLRSATRSAPTCGPSNAFLRVEFGVVVTAESGIRVADRTSSWPEGGCLAFDDGLERERWNRGGSPNFVLGFRVPRTEELTSGRPVPQRAVQARR
ncbi:aspartyl/asparaginyl beta-hydroxylase domain-containing protein [Streptomyces sp. NA02950]|uniref:aspartyl/asparaginyl beta-hydroxylase domain-containing protein n=1 Tax=Streptomyces sp. NA02950 TaxID=2742137 RepID=UPI001590751E|nr:aspartyl/asparaginyl beta-hydroxylase domain-containing protein [Streptomyces sp. NA02950]QKV97140.1 aspartyl/asparaginyl beta-hydroxylase domain-containing protein [Streptomyces sp. NA02950]